MFNKVRFNKVRLLIAALMVAVSMMALPVAASAFTTCGGNPYVTVFEDANVAGASKIFCAGSYSNLSAYSTSGCLASPSFGTWNDCISSFRTTGGSINRPCFYTNSLYGGNKEDGQYSQFSVNYNDAYSSIKFKPPGTAC